MEENRVSEESKKESIEARSITAPRSVLAQAVEAQLLPPERFKGEQEGGVIKLDSINEFVGGIRRVGDHHEAFVYDGKGNLFSTALDPSTADLAQNTAKVYVAVEHPYIKEGQSEDLLKIFTRLGFTGSVADKLIKKWIELGKENYPIEPVYENIAKGNLVNSPRYIPADDWDLEVVDLSPGKGYFVFSVGNSYFYIDPSSLSKKQPLPESDYKTFCNQKKELSNNLRLDEQDTLFTISDKEGKALGTFVGTKPIADPADPNFLYFLNEAQVFKLDLRGVADRTTRPIGEFQMKVNNPQEIGFDPNSNFIVVRSGDNKVSILNKETGDEVKSIDQVKGPILVDTQGDILFVDTQGRLREIQTNFQAIPSGGAEAAERRREEELRLMKDRFASLELGRREEETTRITEKEVATTLRESIARQVDDQITNSADPAEIEKVLEKLQGLKADPANQVFGGVIDEFITRARERLSGVKTAEFEKQLGNYQQVLDEVKSVGDTLGLNEQFAGLLGSRQKIDVTDPQKRREIEQRIRALQARTETVNNHYQGELVDAANQALPQIEQQIKETGSSQELAYFATSTPVQQYEMMLANMRDPQVRRELRDKYKALEARQKTKLSKQSEELAGQDRQRWAQVVTEAREDLESLRVQIVALPDTRELDRFGKNPLITAWRAKLFALPPELRESEEKRLEVILGARKKDIEHRKELGAVGEAGELRFGQTTFSVYKEPPRLWQAEFVPRKGGFSQWVDLVFKDSQGRVYKPGGEHEVVVVEADMTNEQTRMTIERYRGEAEEYFRGLKRRVPEFDVHWRITGYHMVKLEEVAEALNLQLVNHRGILILQGEAGTGKNVLVDMLANLANREVVPVMCNENTVKEDLTYEFYYDPEKGTYKLPSRLVEALQTPGAIILFDEINALKPGIAKLMNSLFDYRRRIYIAEGGKEREIMVDPTVIFVGTMNPQNYAGVNRLSPEVKSRSRVIDLDYPPFEEQRGGRTFYRSDEAEMLAGYMDELGELKQEEFKQCWDYVINRDTTNGADRILGGDPVIEPDIRRIYDVIRVANRLRDMYAAYQVGDSNEPMDFPVSLREVTDIVMEMNHRQGVKEIIKRVIIPKIDDRRQKRLVGETIDAVLP